MRRIIRYCVVVLFLIGLVSGITGLIYLRRLYGRIDEVSPVRLDRTLKSYCTEPSSTNTFQEFWSEFREAVRAENKDKLFSLIDTCSFTWWDQPTLPLAYADCAPGPNQDCYYPAHYLGGGQLFQSRSDFDKTYDRIFAKEFRAKMLTIAPWQVSEERYSVSWEVAMYETYSLNFERIAGVGYKFTGSDWEPVPLDALKTYAAKAREAKPRETLAQPPNSIP